MRSLRWTGVAAIVTVWTTLLTATAVSGFDLLGDDPLSYLGTQPRSAALFTAGLLLPAVLLTAFHHHVRGRYRVSTGFSVAMLVGLVGQVIAGVVPIGGDSVAHSVHTASALVLGVSLPLLMWRFAAAQPFGSWRRLAYGLFWVEAAACAVGLYLSARSIAPLAEILPGTVFHLWIVVVSVGAGVGAGRRLSNGTASDHRDERRRGEPGVAVGREQTDLVDPRKGEPGDLQAGAAAGRPGRVAPGTHR
jgi:hypothetical membrane protein